MKTVTLIAIALALAPATLVLAGQQVVQGTRQFRAMSTPPPVSLLQRADVVSELKIAGPQKAKVDEVVKGVDPRAPETMDAAYQKVTTILNKAQVRRLEEIHRQFAGLRALGYAPYAKELGVTADQLDKLKVIQQEVMQELMKGMNFDKPTDGKPVQIRFGAEEAAKAKRMTDERGLKVLTEAQRKKWKAMLGAPFKGAGA
jgi:hypothetical protein